MYFLFKIFRHGERVPETNEQFPKDEYTIDYFKPLTYGQITKVSIFVRLQMEMLEHHYVNTVLCPLTLQIIIMAYI